MVASWSDRMRQRYREIVEWLRSLFPEASRPGLSQQAAQQSSPEGSQAREQSFEQEGRYQVQNSDETPVFQGNNLDTALRAWRQLTDQEGFIVDTDTGEDITPVKDDTGRYAVLDEQGEQVGTFESFSAAEHVWNTQTHREGAIIDTLEKKDITPFKGHLTDQEVEEALELVTRLGGPGFTRSLRRDRFDETALDLDTVRRLIPVINKLQLPIFELANAQGSRFNLPTRKVKVTKREAVVDRQWRDYYEDVPIEEPPTSLLPSVTPQDHREVRPMRDFGEVVRVSPLHTVMPDFCERFARRELPVVEYQEEIPGEVRTARMRKKRLEETIIPREWEEIIEVTEEPRVQNLVVVCDLSGSMFWDDVPKNAEVAIALCVVLVTKHLDDDSRYGFRWFADYVDKLVSGDSRRSKEDLIEFIMEASAKDEIGGGTSIISGIETAADDVRKLTRSGDIPEVLIVTDGSDSVTAQEIFRAIGTDVVLHAVVINGDNEHLKHYSTTYAMINPWDIGGYRRDPVTSW